MALRSAGKALCSPRPARNSASSELGTVVDIDVTCAARPPPLPHAGPPPPAGTASHQVATKCRPRQIGGSPPREGPLCPRQPLPMVAGGSLPINAEPRCNATSTGSLGDVSCHSNATSASVAGSIGAGSGAGEPTCFSRSSTPRQSCAGSPQLIAAPHGMTQGGPEPSTVNDKASVEELRAENLKLQREVERLRDSLLSIAGGTPREIGTMASSSKRAVGGGFRGSAIRSGEKKGGEVTEKEVESLRMVLHKKSSKISKMEELLAAMQADGLSQERSLSEMQNCLANATSKISASDAQQQALENHVQDLNIQLESERHRIHEVLRNAADVSASNEELSDTLLSLREQLQAKSSACKAAEDHAIGLESELSTALAKVVSLASEMDHKQAETQEIIQRCSAERRELHHKYLVALSLRDSVLRLCWEAWMQKIVDRRVAAALERLRDEVHQSTLVASESAEMASIRSAEDRHAAHKEQEDLCAEMMLLRNSAAEARSIAYQASLEAEGFNAQLEESSAELRVRDSELTAAEASAISSRAESSQLRKALNVSAKATNTEAALARQVSELHSSEAKLRGQAQDLDKRLREAKACQAAKDTQARQASEARDACAAREAALKTRVGDLEQRLRTFDAVGSTAKRGSGASGEDKRDKMIQREETLLREIRRAEQERDEARAQLQRVEQQRKVPKPPAGPVASAGINSPRRSTIVKKAATDATELLAPTSQPNDTQDAAAANSAVARMPELERELATESSLSMQFRDEVLEARAQHAECNERQASLEKAAGECEESREVANSLRAELSEARADMSLQRVDVRRLRQAREELESSLKGAREEASSSVAEAKKWREAVEVAVAQVQKSLRILVTAPKVSINLGSNEFSLQKGAIHRDIEQIRSIVNEQVLPSFQRILVVAEEESENEVRGTVMRMVEELAGKVQQEVYRVLPQAEGTASWDGFGSRVTSLK